MTVSLKYLFDKGFTWYGIIVHLYLGGQHYGKTRHSSGETGGV